MSFDQRAEPGYDANYFVDWLLQHLNIKNDAQLSRRLDVAPPVISKIRQNKLAVGDRLLVKIHLLTNMRVDELCRKMVKS